MKPHGAFRMFAKTLKSFNRKEEILSVLLVILISLSGYNIAKSINDDLVPARSNDNGEIAEEGGAYSEGLVGNVKRLNPLFTEFNSVDKDIASLIFSGLSKYSPNEKKVVEDMATHTLSEDKKTYTFIIRDNVFWHDGKPVTGEDVYFTYHDIIQNPNFKNSILRSNFEGIDIKLLDAKTITFTLKNAHSFFFTNTTVGILPKHILNNVPVEDLDKHEFNLHPIGSGPYMLAEPVKNIEKNENQIYLTLFPEYYGKKPHVKDLRFFTFATEEELFQAKNALNGLSKITEISEIEKLKKDGRYQLLSYSLPQYTAVFFNMDSPILKNSSVRLGLSKAIDKKNLIQILGLKKQIDTPLLELDQENWIHKFSIEQAMGSLFDAGWKFDEGEAEEGKIRKDRKGNELTLNLITQSFSKNSMKQDENEKTLKFLVDSWKKAGVKIQVLRYEEEEFNAKIRNEHADYDMILAGQGMGYNLDTYSFWHSSQSNGKGLNLSNYKNPVVDNLIETIREIFQTETKETKLQKLADQIQTDVPAIFLYSPEYYYAVDVKVKNASLGSLAFPADRLTNFLEWYIKEKKNS
ncbi:hypothetical protein HYV57_03605 [Candidatus Peregrinibacteria bacterium]|nr:hypothetical protein [Candidatus Peregrinibacteria bacterium]